MISPIYDGTYTGQLSSRADTSWCCIPCSPWLCSGPPCLQGGQHTCNDLRVGLGEVYLLILNHLLQVVKKNVETIEVEEGTRTRENLGDNVVDVEDNGHVIVQGGEDNLAFKAGSDVEDK